MHKWLLRTGASADAACNALAELRAGGPFISRTALTSTAGTIAGMHVGQFAEINYFASCCAESPYQAEEAHAHHDNGGAIAGAVLGGIAAIGLVTTAIIAWGMCRRYHFHSFNDVIPCQEPAACVHVGA